MTQTVDLGLVRGAKGDKGDTGATGAVGPVGPQGPQGERGIGFPEGGTENQTAIMGSTNVEWVDPLVAKNRLGIASITDATALVASNNLDTFRTIGTYYCETDEIADSLANSPVDVRFVMVVSKSNATDEYIGQEIVESVKGTRYFRSYKLNTGTWSNWRKSLDVDVIGATNSDSIADMVYPIGSVYMSTVSTSPAALFGGTWARIQDAFLLAAGSEYAAGTTGGEATHTLTVNEMPSHSHSFNVNYGSSGSTWARAGVQGGSAGESTTTAGGDAAHNNMPPYLTVYVWKRTA